MRVWPLLPGVLIPALVAAVALGLSRRRGFASGVGYLAGHLLIRGWPPFPPLETTDWPLSLALAAMVVSWREPIRRPIRAILHLIFTGAVLFLTLRPLIGHTWTFRQSVAWLGGLSLALLVLWEALDTLADSPASAALPPTLALIGTALGLSIALSGSLVLGRLTLALGASLAAVAVGGRWLDRKRVHGGLTVAFVLLVSLGLNGFFYAELPITTALLFSVAPLTCAVGRLERLQRHAALAGLLAASVPVCAAVALAIL